MEREQTPDVGQRHTYLTFQCGPSDFGVRISYVREIIAILPVTEVPGFPPYVRGILNLRGRMIPLIDLRARLGLDFQDYGERTCVIILEWDQVDVGLVVDAVDEVMRIAPDAVQQSPEVGQDPETLFVGALGRVGDSVKLLLDVDRVLAADDLQSKIMSFPATNGVKTDGTPQKAGVEE